MIKTNIEFLRDPFILVEDDAYYAYGTGVTKRDLQNSFWVCYKNDSGKLDGEWKMTEKPVCVLPENAVMKRWAPEVHKYKGSYYMFATYHSSATNHKGCTVLKADSPEGPFIEISDGFITPIGRHAIDATLYVDEEGQPWVIYVDEWTNAEDKVGKMCAAKLSDDLTHTILEPIDLFYATEPEWAVGKITDGCYMYKTQDNQLLMIWSNFDKDGYCVAIARSNNGKIDGRWSHDKKLLFSKATIGEYDGGHGMIFKDKDGRMYLSIHSPNEPTDGSGERTVFVPIHEENGTLVCAV